MIFKVLPGRMTFIKLFKRIVLRTIREDRFLTVLSVLGVALGIGLFMGVNTATNRALSSFESTISSLDQPFNYEVVSVSGIDFPDLLYKQVRSIADKSLPVLSTNVFLPEWKETAAIHGIYTVRSLGFLNSASNNPDIEDFFKRRNGVLVTKALSERLGLKRGDSVAALVYNRKYVLFIVGALDMPSVPAGTIIMDLGNYQEFFGKAGLLSRIDIIADGNTAEEIRLVLPGGLIVAEKEKVIRNRQSLVDAFRFNLRFVTFLAVLAGIFLLYNTIFISVIKRRTEIGILRGLGMDRKMLVALFSGQGMLLGLFGSILGIAFGQASAWSSTRMVGMTVTRFYGQQEVARQGITLNEALWTLGTGIVISFLSSIIPALESANVRPVESSRAGTFEKSYKRRQGIFSIIGAISFLFALIAIWVDYRHVPFSFPWLSYVGILLFILGCTLNAPAYLGMSLAFMRPGLNRLFKTASRIALADMSGTRYRFSLALMSVAVSSALIVAIVSSIYSLKTSFVDWINTYVNADAYIKPASCTSNFCFYPLPDDVFKNVSQLPGVETVGRFRALEVQFRGKPVIAGFGDSALLWKRPGAGKDERERLQRLAQYREVLISDYLSVKYGLKRGDTIEIPTPEGGVPFTINNTSISYSTMSGFMYFDRRWLQEYWGIDDATQLSVYLKNKGNVRHFIDQVKKRLGDRYALEITDNNELRQSVLEIFDKSFAITYAHRDHRHRHIAAGRGQCAPDTGARKKTRDLGPSLSRGRLAADPSGDAAFIRDHRHSGHCAGERHGHGYQSRDNPRDQQDLLRVGSRISSSGFDDGIAHGASVPYDPSRRHSAFHVRPENRSQGFYQL